jgi:hypothetical protein
VTPFRGSEIEVYRSHHRLTLEAVDGPPAAVDAGAEMRLTLRASCGSGCPLPDVVIDLVASDGTAVPTTADPAAGEETGGIVLLVNAPRQAGAFVWSAVARRCEAGTVIHEASEPVALTFRTLPHETSMAVWDVTSPVVAQSPVRVSVGLRCAAGCPLPGHAVDIVDEGGLTVGRGMLGESPLTGTDALYWTAIELTAPETLGVARYRAVFSSAALELPHAGSEGTFSFRTTGRPEHQMIIDVVEKDTGAGVGDVEISLGPYLRMTDAAGRLQLAVPGGTYRVSVRKDGFSAPPMEAHVSADTSIRIAGMAVPTMAEIAPNLTSFDGYPWG